eukprot:TRINITY_DN5274_c0_g1_i1.p1 TRINITY_DN5274_c0_g1~~TRINITY_DN5274_c0_g1_i1.p1  ORF type:complete len:700 (-),score=105.80 TRINITY_DN5274_c0_g1_i1:90-2189(-)
MVCFCADTRRTLSMSLLPRQPLPRLDAAAAVSTAQSTSSGSRQLPPPRKNTSAVDGLRCLDGGRLFRSRRLRFSLRGIAMNAGVFALFLQPQLVPGGIVLAAQMVEGEDSDLDRDAPIAARGTPLDASALASKSAFGHAVASAPASFVSGEPDIRSVRVQQVPGSMGFVGVSRAAAGTSTPTASDAVSVGGGSPTEGSSSRRRVSSLSVSSTDTVGEGASLRKAQNNVSSLQEGSTLKTDRPLLLEEENPGSLLPPIPEGARPPTAFINPPRIPLRFPVLALTEELHLRSRQEEMAESDNGQSEIQPWFWLFVVTTILLFVLMKCVTSQFPVDMIEDPDPEVQALKEKSCWTPCVGIACLGLAFLSFYATLVNVEIQNKLTRKHPRSSNVNEDTRIVTTRYIISNPGQRAFLAGHGVTLSLFMAICLMASWRHHDKVQISVSHLTKFAFRGGSLSLIIALALETAGSRALGAGGMREDGGLTLGTALLMACIGFSEEFAKIVSVTCGTCTSSIHHRTSTEECSTCWVRSLVDAPRGMALAGLASGFGFMTVENAGYVMAAAMMPPTSTVVSRWPQEPEGGRDVISTDEVSGASITFLTAMTVLVRVLLNIHPWLAGISAIRLSRLAFKPGNCVATLSAFDMFCIVFPSSIAHGAYDFLITVLTPALIGLLVPPVFWLFSRHYFSAGWAKIEEDIGEERT